MNGIWSKDWNPMSFCPFTHPLLDSRSHQTVSSRFTAMTGHHLANGCLTNPKTPAGTQAHFTFPSKVSLLFSIRAPGNRGEGGGGGSNWGQEHWEEEGWANRQTLKVTIHHFTSNIKDTAERFRHRLGYLFYLTLRPRELKCWKGDYTEKQNKTRKWHSLIAILPKCSVRSLHVRMCPVFPSLFSLDLILLPLRKHSLQSSPFCQCREA